MRGFTVISFIFIFVKKKKMLLYWAFYRDKKKIYIKRKIHWSTYKHYIQVQVYMLWTHKRYTNVHTHTHIRTYTRKHMYIYTYVHTYIHTLYVYKLITIYCYYSFSRSFLFYILIHRSHWRKRNTNNTDFFYFHFLKR